MTDKICPLMQKECIMEKCKGYGWNSIITCALYENENWRDCPANKIEVIIFGKKIFTYIRGSHSLFAGSQKHCIGCKYRRKHVWHKCKFAGGKTIKHEYLDASEDD